MDVKLVPDYLSRTVKWWLHNPGCHLDRRLTLDSSYRETLGDLLKGITKDKQVSLSNKIPISEIEIIWFFPLARSSSIDFASPTDIEGKGSLEFFLPTGYQDKEPSHDDYNELYTNQIGSQNIKLGPRIKIVHLGKVRRPRCGKELTSQKRVWIRKSNLIHKLSLRLAYSPLEGMPTRSYNEPSRFGKISARF